MNIGLLKTKTFWTGAATILGAVGGVFLGELSIIGAAQLIVPALMGIFVRDGIITASR